MRIWGKGVSKQLGKLLMISAPLLFVLSMFFLVNTSNFPEESLPYKIGQFLCLIASPALLVSGLAIYVVKRRAEGKGKRAERPSVEEPLGKEMLSVEEPSRKETLRKCPRCDKDLSSFPSDIKKCAYCGTSLVRKTTPVLRVLRIVKNALGLAFLLLFLYILFVRAPQVVPFPPLPLLMILLTMPPFPFLIIPYLCISLYLLLSRRFRIIDVVLIAICFIMFYYLFTFFTPSALSINQIEIVEALDVNVNVTLMNKVPPTPESFKTEYEGGETIYPSEQGLGKGTRYGFRIVGPEGNIIVPLDENQIAEVQYGDRMEGVGFYNTEENPLPPGSYRMELIVVEGGRGLIMAYEDFVVRG